MTLFKRHIGRRAAGIGIAAALLMLGLEAPAFAAAPTITSFTPTSGPAGCVVTITGTNFDNPPVDDVEFNNVDAASFFVVSATQIRAEAPATVSTGKIELTSSGAGGGTVQSTADFTVASPGTCAPTITSFTPTCGAAGTSVTITGTNLFNTATTAGTVQFNGKTATSTVATSTTQISAVVPSSATTGKITVATKVATATSTTDFTVGSCVTITSFTPTFGPVGTQVTIIGTGFTGATAVSFNNVNATTFTVNPAGTQITATVPTGATTGKIKVTTPSGSATSTADFVVSTVHSRSITLSLRKHLVARGMVTVGDGFTACAASVPVRIQRRVSGSWKTVGKTTTTDTGAYKKRIRDRAGRYRARATRIALNNGADVCSRATSPVRRHRH
jgi:hypothetical protein